MAKITLTMPEEFVGILTEEVIGTGKGKGEIAQEVLVAYLGWQRKMPEPVYSRQNLARLRRAHALMHRPLSAEEKARLRQEA